MRVLWIASMLPAPFNWLAGPWNIRSLVALRDYEGLDVCAVRPIGMMPPSGLVGRFPPDVAGLRQWLGVRRATAAAGEVQGVPVTYPRWVWPPKKLFWGYEGRLMYRQLRRHLARVVKDFRPDVIHAPWLNPEAVTAALCGAEHGIPTVAQAIGNDANYYLGRFPATHVVNADLQKASVLLFNCQSTRRAAAAAGLNHRRVEVIYHGVDVDTFRPAADRPAGAERRIITVAQLIPRKNHQLLLRAYASLPDDVRREVALEFVGGGASRPGLERQARELGIGDRVHFAGQPPHAELIQRLQQADLFCLPSLSEGMPVASIEAMACGLPVVASNVDGIPEAVQEGISGTLFTSNDVASLTDALRRALARTWDREAVRQVVLSKFTWRRYAADVHALYRSLRAG